MGTQGFGNPRNSNRGRRVGDPEPGGQSAGHKYREGAGRRMVGDERMIRKLGSDVVDGKRQAATGTGRREPGGATAGFVVGDRRLRRSLGIQGGRKVGDRQGQ